MPALSKYSTRKKGGGDMRWQDVIMNIEIKVGTWVPNEIHKMKDLSREDVIKEIESMKKDRAFIINTVVYQLDGAIVITGKRCGLGSKVFEMTCRKKEVKNG